MTNKFERFKTMFLDECDEHARTLEQTLTAMQHGARSQELVDDAFRAIHSIKGGAGMFGFDRIVPFAHKFETVLDGIRLGQIAISEELMSAALRATDCLSDLILAAGSGTELAPDYEKSSIRTLLGWADSAPSYHHRCQLLLRQRPMQLCPGFNSTLCHSFWPACGPAQTRQRAPAAGAPVAGTGANERERDLSRLPPSQTCSQRSHFSWNFELETSKGEAAIRDVFQFVEGDCDLTIRPHTTEAAAPVEVQDFRTQHLRNKSSPWLNLSSRPFGLTWAH